LSKDLNTGWRYHLTITHGRRRTSANSL